MLFDEDYQPVTTVCDPRVSQADTLHGSFAQLPGNRRLKALILLAGSIRPTPLRNAVGRSLLDLPVDASRSIGQLWLGQAAHLGLAMGADSLDVQVVLDQRSPRPISVSGSRGLHLRIRPDPAEFRGTGGILHDLACEYEEDDRLLVASAAQILLEPIERLAAALCRADADVALIAHEDGTPCNMMVVRCGSLAMLPEVGFVDMKEQALPLIAKRHSVKVLLRGNPAGLSLLTFRGYLNALHRYYLKEANSAGGDPFAEDWRPCFAVVEHGAAVARGAKVHNSVVLGGAQVGRNAVVVRSVVCPGGKIAPGQVVVDQMVVPAKGQAGR